MKITQPFLSLALLIAASSASVTSRVLPVDSPYARSTVGLPALEPRTFAYLFAAESTLHHRVTRHIRPDLSTPSLIRRQTVDNGGITNFNNTPPQPIRDSKGAPFLHESNTPIDKQNIDYLSPAPPDSGNIPNLKWFFSLSHSRLLNGGWVREQTVTDLPSSSGVAAAEQRLAPYAYRELHWHRVAEWGLVFNGTVHVTANDQDNRNYVGDAKKGDLWSLPTGIPHTLQAGPEGAEYLLVFDDGNFDASGTTFMLDDWIAHTPRDVLAKNFGWDPSVFSSVPTPDPYIVAAKQDETWLPLADAQKAVEAPGCPTLASAYVYVEKGGLRELHWHKNAEWGYIVKGKARATAFAGGATARTFELQAGDSWVFPTNYGHYIQNIGDEPLEFVEIFRGGNFGDKVRFDNFSLTQWLALLPASVAAKQLNVSQSLVEQLKREKQIVVAARQ